MALKRRIFDIIEPTNPDDRANRIFNILMMALIALNIVALVAESVSVVEEAAADLLWHFEVFSVVIFTSEYLLRLWVCTESTAYSRPLLGRLRFALRPMMIVDLLSIAPLYLQLHADLRMIRVFRLFRLLRMMKLGRYSSALNLLRQAILLRKEELLATMLILLVLVLMASSLMYYAEHDAQPNQFSSIPAAMWWAVITLTTIGYGDIYPVTVFGKVLGGIIAILGIGMVALPTGILSTSLVQLLETRRKPAGRCPHCGGEIEPGAHASP